VLLFALDEEGDVYQYLSRHLGAPDHVFGPGMVV
jgi:hypothetical protein